MRSVALSVVFVVLLCLGATPMVAGGVVAATPTDADGITDVAVQPSSATAGSMLPVGADAAPSTEFTIRLQSNRDAEWEITLEYTLETASEREAFRSIAAEYEDGTAPAGGLSVELYENIASLASDETNREMQIQDVERTSELDGGTGTLRLAFTWSAFLEEDGEQLVFNDALQTPDEGTWLHSLDESQQLQITTPRGYSITSANVAFAQNTVTIEGPHTFDPDDHVRIILEPSAFGSATWELLGAAVVVGAAIIGGALLLRRRDDESAEPRTDSPPTPSTTTGDKEPPAEDAHAADPESAEAAEPDASGEDVSLLADDERILQLLDRNDGRMRQADIVAETDWSDAKVSQLLSSMADDEMITKLRIGRENLISLPDVDALDGSKRDDE